MRPVAWECEVCTTRYATPELATACEAQTRDQPQFQPGDVVTVGKCWGWFDGDPHWVANLKRVDPHGTGKTRKQRAHACPHGDRNCFGDCCNYSFYYVVTAVDREPARSAYRPETHINEHRWRYHLLTGGRKHGDAPATGFTFDHGHWAPERVARVPKHIRVAIPGLIGRRTDRLL